MPRAKRNSKLTKFLKRYSKHGKKIHVKNLYKQWRLIEVRDVGRNTTGFRCHCGHGPLRYLCFISNSQTRVQTYVGAVCIRYFAKPNVPRMICALDRIARAGMKVQYLRSSGKNHHFRIREKCCLVKKYTVMSHFFSKLPYRRSNGKWCMTTWMGYTTSHKPILRPGAWYRVRLGAITTARRGKRPQLRFLIDHMRRAK